MFVDERRELEVEIVSADNIYIDCISEITTKSFPKLELVLLKSVNTKEFCHSICHYKGVTYMATIEALVAIDEDFNSKTLVSGYYRTYFIMLHENRIYVSYETSGSPLRINVYGLTGQPISEWVGKDNGNFSRPAIVSNQIVVPDTRNQQLTVYSLSGETLRYISNFQLTGDIGRSSSICTADKNCIIVSTMVSSQISKILKHWQVFSIRV